MANSFHLVLVAVRLTGGPWFRNSSKGWGEVKSPHWGGNQKCCWRDFFIGWWVPEEDWFWWFEPFSKLKPAFCEQWVSVKIKTSMTCVHKEYEVKTKMVQENFFNWDSFYARLSSHYDAWSYKKKKHKKIRAHRKSV